MSDIYDALIGGGPTSQDQMGALTAALRKQKILGSVLAMSGDKALAPIGGQLGQDADQNATSIGQAGALEKWRKLQTDRLAQNDKMDFDAQQARTAEMGQAAKDRTAERAQADADRKYYRGLNDTDRAAAAKDKEDQKGAQQLERYTAQFSAKLQGTKVPQLSVSMNNVNSLMNDFKAKGLPIPGVGYAKNTRLGRSLLSDDGKRMQGAIQGVTNDLLNLYSGVAVTDPETQRRLIEQSQTMFDSEENFKNGWKYLVDKYNEVKNNIAGGYDGKVKHNYRANGGMNLDDITPAFEPAEVGGGKSKTAAAPRKSVPEFASQAEAAQAVMSKRIAVGDEIRIGGKPFTVTPDE